MKKHLPPEPAPNPKGGRKRIDPRSVLNGIWYVLWTGCQWKAVHRDWFGASSSVLHERFQTWQAQGVWDAVFQALVKFYRRERRIQWQWQAVDSRSCAAPLGGSATGKNPTDRAKLGAKIHLLVDQRGAPLAIEITGANQHDKWSVAYLVLHIAVPRPGSSNTSWPTKATITPMSIRPSSKRATANTSSTAVAAASRRLKRAPVPGEEQFPARRWVVERTFAWLVKRRSIRTRWCKKASNWLAFVQFACASILCDLAVFG